MIEIIILVILGLFLQMRAVWKLRLPARVVATIILVAAGAYIFFRPDYPVLEDIVVPVLFASLLVCVMAIDQGFFHNGDSQDDMLQPL